MNFHRISKYKQLTKEERIEKLKEQIKYMKTKTKYKPKLIEIYETQLKDLENDDA